MPRKIFKKYCQPRKRAQSPAFRRFGGFLHHPNLWHLNRHSVAGGIAVGLFAGLVPAHCRC